MAPFLNNKLLSTFIKKIKKIGMYTHIKTHTQKKPNCHKKYVKYYAPEQKLL